MVTLGNSPVYWGGLPDRFSGAPRGLWGCVNGPITLKISKKKKMVREVPNGSILASYFVLRGIGQHFAFGKKLVNMSGAR